MPLLSNNATSIIISNILIIAAFLVSVGISGYVSAYLKLFFLDDRLAIEEGYGTLNPFVHTDILSVILFLFLRIFWRTPQPFDGDFRSGIKGFFQKAVYLLGVCFVHLFIASLLLLLGISFWKISFLKISPIISEVPSEKILKMIHMIHQNMSGFSKVSFIFLAQLVNINIILGICEWCSKIIRYALQKTMANDESSLNPWTPFIYMIALFTILYFFGATIVMAAWMIVSVPAVYFAQLIGAL